MQNKKKLIASYDNFLDRELINQINTYADESLHKPRWQTSHFWQDRLRNFGTPVAVLLLPDEFFIPICQTLKKKTPFTWKDSNPPQRSMYYLYSPGGCIGWHDDAPFEFSSMIWLNPVWNLDWGGLHLYEDLNNLGIRAEVPTFNRCLVYSGGIPHGVSILSPAAPLRRAIITFAPKSDSKKYLDKKGKEWEEWKKKRNMDVKYARTG